MPFSGVALNSPLDVFIFILGCSFYICSILWIYGDAATRGFGGWKGSMLPLSLIIVGLVASTGIWWLLVVWVVVYAGWWFRRPPPIQLKFD